MLPKYSDSVAFLRKWSPTGPWVLTSINPDERGDIETHTFDPGTLDELTAWLERRGASCNMYFSVNPTTGGLSKKASIRDITRMDWLHVDIDPRVGEDIMKEQVRILKLLNDPIGGVPRPTCVVFSGGGYQAFWRMETPITIDGDSALAEDAKRWNLRLELILGADNCHNIDRIMRLPGTINRPDARKRDKGRVEALAAVEWFVGGGHPWEDFKQSVVSGAEKTTGPRALELTGNHERFARVDDIPGVTNDNTKAIIVQGIDLENPGKFGASRSEWLFHVCCEMVRAGCSDDVIYSVITDCEYAISESVLEKGPGADRYAQRQIMRARDEEAESSSWLREMNDKYWHVRSLGGKCVVMHKYRDAARDCDLLQHQTIRSFEDSQRGTKVQIGEKKDGEPIFQQKGKAWLDHERHRVYERVTFAPGGAPEDVYNRWQGFHVRPAPGDCSLFMAHIKDNICGGIAAEYEYLIQWMARSIQRPERPGETAIVLRSKPGAGKGFFVHAFGHLFGQHYAHVVGAGRLTHQFNSHLQGCVLLFADEVFASRNEQHAAVLKGLITEPTVMIEGKGLDAGAQANCLHIMMASNADWVVPVGLGDRRFFVLDVSNDHAKDRPYFKTIDAQLNAGGYEALLHFLMTYDITEFDVSDIPDTRATQSQREYSLDERAQWWQGRLQAGTITERHVEWPMAVSPQSASTIASRRAGLLFIKSASAPRCWYPN